MHASAPISLILVDVHFFKLFNDNYRHQAEVDCVCQVAQALRREAKWPGDLVACPSGGFCIGTARNTTRGRSRRGQFNRGTCPESGHTPHPFRRLVEGAA